MFSLLVINGKYASVSSQILVQLLFHNSCLLVICFGYCLFTPINYRYRICLILLSQTLAGEPSEKWFNFRNFIL